MLIDNLEVYGIIYRIQNKKDGKVYIGQTVNGFDKRYPCKKKENPIIGVYRQHKYMKDSKRPYNKHLLRSIEKHGFDSFVVDKIIDVAMTNEELDKKEIFWIDKYNSTNIKYGYNRQEGGKGIVPYKGYGENSRLSKHKDEEVEKCKVLLKVGFNQAYISKITGIKTYIIANIKFGRSWRKVREDLNEQIINHYNNCDYSKEEIINFNSERWTGMTYSELKKSNSVDEDIPSKILYSAKELEDYKRKIERGEF